MNKDDAGQLDLLDGKETPPHDWSSPSSNEESIVGI